jgi:hypothetical protein
MHAGMRNNQLKKKGLFPASIWDEQDSVIVALANFR